MYVCVCMAITERDIRHAAGRGVCSLKDLRHELGVGGECGKCAAEARHCLRKELERIAPRQQKR